MIKLAFRLVFFVAGCGVGVWYGVHHPAEAKQLSDVEDAKIQQAVALAKTQLLQQVIADATKPAATPGGSSFMGGGAAPASLNVSKYQDMLNESQQQLSAANARAK